MKSVLEKLGIKNIFFGSGNRNEPLLEEFKDFRISFGLDERSLAFEALGLAKLTGEPVAVCITSGTAVAECYPAVIEAFYSDVKLVIISADRPPELRGSRAPQTINQEKIFGNYANYYWEGYLEAFNSDFNRKEFKYPAQINVFVDSERLQNRRIDRPTVDALSNKQSAGLAIFTEGSENFEEEFNRVQDMGLSTFVEIHSGLRKVGSIGSDQELVALAKRGTWDFFVKFGRTPVSKSWRLLNTELSQLGVFSFNDNSTGCWGGMKLCSLDELESLNLKKIRRIESTPPFEEFPESEASLILEFTKNLESKSILYFGNSMPIRYGDFCKSTIIDQRHKVLASRGANGIDGQLSTACGIARGTSERVYAFFGDLTFLYDLTRVFWELPDNLLIVVINNYGGRIFERVQANSLMVLEHRKDLANFANRQVKIIQPKKEQTDLFWIEWHERVNEAIKNG